MTIDSIAALPMYDFAELTAWHDALWHAIAMRLRNAGVMAPLTLTRDRGPIDLWQHPRLLLGQGCEYPIATSFFRFVRPVATPRYAVPGCDGARYRSAIVVRHDDAAQNLAQLHGRRCVINEVDSNSGMNLLRAVIAPLSGGQPFFATVERSGAHRRSAAMVAEGLADVAALDCVSYAHFRLLEPKTVSRLRVLAWTDPSPSLPYITARATDAATLAALRASLASVMSDAALEPVRRRLFLDGFDFAPAEDYAAVMALAQRARDHGYPVLV